MLKEIGSNFWLNPDSITESDKHIDISSLGIHGQDSVFLSTGRGAQLYVLKDIEAYTPDIRKVALIPPFTCRTVIEPFMKMGYKLHSYPVDDKLITTSDMLKGAIDEYAPSIVLIHRYFGFDTLKDCDALIAQERAKGILFIEDRTQNIFSDFECLSVDYVIGSLRKWAGLPDGGFASSKKRFLLDKPTQYNSELMHSKLHAMFAKYEYMINNRGEKQDFLSQYSDAEVILNAEDELYGISPASEAVFCSLNVNELKKKRRSNYTIIYNELKNSVGIKVLMPALSDCETPLYFVLYVADRDKLQNKLREESIYAPVVWPLSDISPDVCEEALDIYRHVLCIPIDQRYDESDMDRICKCIKQG
ncbi:MAG: hypothetical protein IJO61_03385 [Oscillospiraceae bacterium]|nr:hypothetical protein [Oscillospiraceae bacterium]